ncbi:MAG: hypothetical protein VYD90_08255 [Pseudomonadota bacterium]|nr:hypothetical protein [Pseudomonadota bacterium]
MRQQRGVPRRRRRVRPPAPARGLARRGHRRAQCRRLPGPGSGRTPCPLQHDFYRATVATIGAPEDEGAVTGTADFDDQGRARVEGRNAGLLTLHAAAPDGRLIGADMVAPAGEHLAHMLAWAIQEGRTASELLSLPFYHPTIEEGLKNALRTICQATPIDLPQDQDAGTPPGA